jgi:hypothetical protein
VISGSTVPLGSGVSPSGPAGPQGAQGIQGPSGAVPEAPTDGQLYGRQSSAWSVVSSGGGIPDPATGLFIQEDFLYVQNYVPNGPYWSGAVSGTGASVNAPADLVYGQDSTRKMVGINTLRVGASGNTGALMYIGSPNQASNPWGITLGFGAFKMKARLAINASPTAGGNVAIRFGLGAYASTPTGGAGPPNNGIYFEYQIDTTANWRYAKSVSGTQTYTNSTTAVVINAAFWLELDLSSDGSTATFYVAGVSIGTITGLSFAANPLCPILQNMNNGTTASMFVAIDKFYLNYAYTN